MPARLIYFIVFIEGFCSLGAEVIGLRRLVPHMGSSIVVTAPTIGFFLLALALGYAAGAKVAEAFLARVRWNFLLAAALAGLGLARPVLDGLFIHLPTSFAYLLFIGGILAPLAYLLGQTVPILTNLSQHQRVGEASGQALFWSTLGSFLGSLTLSLVVMQWLGVAAAVVVCALLLCAGIFVLPQGLSPARQWQLRGGIMALASLIITLNLWQYSEIGEISDTAYADYAVVPVNLPGQVAPHAFKVNNSVASLLDHSEPPHYARYVQQLRRIIHEELQLKNKEILVLGAGGFTLSHGMAVADDNHYTFVDIDPAIRQLAEEKFLHRPIVGEFVVTDARQFVHRSDKRYDMVVVDVYSALTAIPSHLVTQEFWRETQRVLNPDGVMVANLILDGRLQSPYARNLLATIESVYGRCAVDVLHKNRPLANVVLSCFARPAANNNVNPPMPALIYRDERNQADLDIVRNH